MIIEKECNCIIPDYIPSFHETRIEEYFKIPLNIPDRTKEILNKINITFLVYTNRTGSNLVTDILEQTGIFTLGTENFNSEEVIKFSNLLGISNLGDYFSGIIIDQALSKKVVCLKVRPTQLLYLAKSGAFSCNSQNINFFFLKRKNKLKQAISYFIASSSGRWSQSRDHQKSELIDIDINLSEKDVKLIFESIADTLVEESLADKFFNLNNLNKSEFVFEDLEHNPVLYTFNKIKEHRLNYDLECFIDLIPRLSKQYSHVNEEILKYIILNYSNSELHKNFINYFKFDPFLRASNY
jgi:LPS sulfotransferase NodH